MANSKKETGSASSLQRVLAQEKTKITTRYDVNEILFSWEANDRPQYNFSGAQKSIFTFLVIGIALYFYWIGQPILTLFAAAIFFVLFAMIATPPMRVKHQIEKIGIRTMDTLYVWEDFKYFWFAEREGIVMLYVETRLRFPPRLIFIIDSFNEVIEIMKILAPRLDYRYLREAQPRLEVFLEGKYIDPAVFFGPEQVQRAVSTAIIRDDNESNTQ